MFLGEDRLPVVRRMILAQDAAEEAAALEELRRVQKADFVEILDAMDGLPVTVRLLDPPLHEFLPRVDELEVKAATTGLDAEEDALLKAAKSWHEFNPMLGTRGVRLGVVKPGLYAMQVRALMEAAAELRAEGKNPIVEVMIPLTVTREEMHEARGWVEEAIAEATKGLTQEARGHHRHDDRDAAGRAPRRRDRRGVGLLLVRHQRPDPDDLRLQPGRRREPHDAGLPGARPAEAQPVRDHRRSPAWASS